MKPVSRKSICLSSNASFTLSGERMLDASFIEYNLAGGLAQLVTSLVASTKLINAGPG